MSKTNNLTDFLTDIASTIRLRFRLSSTLKINPLHFIEYIGELNSHHINVRNVSIYKSPYLWTFECNTDDLMFPNLGYACSISGVSRYAVEGSYVTVKDGTFEIILLKPFPNNDKVISGTICIKSNDSDEKYYGIIYTEISDNYDTTYVMRMNEEFRSLSLTVDTAMNAIDFPLSLTWED